MRFLLVVIWNMIQAWIVFCVYSILLLFKNGTSIKCWDFLLLAGELIMGFQDVMSMPSELSVRPSSRFEDIAGFKAVVSV